ncbi:fused DSP-PTPase phosphatase/NAD kinase-like protein [Arsukibacterium indicum]|uniref:DSP-PTPase phosphatase fused to NAD+ Kinase domain-containing protein n=1 Tax=Arsukibacterium indicum TaxID=2848612 RepID=A0ABS6MIW7_9GAMM|nr:sulfur transferase domain-containing protein [Arsukibacterium indicum]MBV2128695.1 hypothetical protein [Arsukibacterium indicum]
MRVIKHVLTLFTIGLLLIGFQTKSVAGSNIPDNFNQPSENLITGGQPTQVDLQKFKAAGVSKVINLRGPGEAVNFDEKAEAEALGLSYISLPVAGAGDVTAENARKLYQLLQGEEKVVVHCASGNRVGALLAIGAHEVNGKPVEASLEFGRAAGLSSLEPKVRAVLGDEGRQ